MKCVLDSSIFFCDCPVEGELFTPPSVPDELRDLRAKGKFEKFLAEGLRIVSPTKESRAKVLAAAEKSRDARVISGTDCDLLALALDCDAVLFTDDFAIQNVAAELGVVVHPIQQRAAKKIVWKYRCSGCGRYSDTDGECLICGAQIRRKLK
jgi:endoribonuclease Nob1